MKVQTNNARVAVVLCTYNGAAYLDAQLDSLAASSRPIDLLIVSDDGSTDTSLAIIDRHLSDWGRRVSVYPNRTNVGFAQNFFSALRRVPDDVDWIFLCDQDDVWHRDKMACALRRGASVDPARAYLYTCRQRLVDAAGKFVRLSPQFDRPGFRSALVQNVATGCATMINRAALDLFLRSDPGDTEFHDWWLYAIVSGAGGVIDLDPQPLVDYRQHGGNVVGSPRSAVQDKFERLGRLWSGTSRRTIDRLLTALAANRTLLLTRNAALLDALISARAAPWYQRAGQVVALPIERQTPLDTVICKTFLIAGRL